MWLVFDLGGGTLDVSLLKTQDGRLRVVDHSGDNFLGGRDMDNVLVDWAIGELRRKRGVPQLERENPQSRRALCKLKAACEQTKIELSRQERATITVSELCEDDLGHSVNVDLSVARSDFAKLIEPCPTTSCTSGPRSGCESRPPARKRWLLDHGEVEEHSSAFVSTGEW